MAFRKVRVGHQSDLGQKSRALDRVNILLLGNRCCGKSSLVTSLTGHSVPGHYVPTDLIVTTHYFKQEDGEMVEMVLYDTAGAETWSKLSRMFLRRADIILLCTSVDNGTCIPDPSTTQHWLNEISKLSEDTPVIVVGCKVDSQNGHRLEGDNWEDYLAKLTLHYNNTNCQTASRTPYMACSSLTEEGIQHLFATATTMVQYRRKTNHSKNGQFYDTRHKQCTLL